MASLPPLLIQLAVELTDVVAPLAVDPDSDHVLLLLSLWIQIRTMRLLLVSIDLIANIMSKFHILYQKL